MFLSCADFLTLWRSIDGLILIDSEDRFSQPPGAFFVLSLGVTDDDVTALIPL